MKSFHAQVFFDSDPFGISVASLKKGGVVFGVVPRSRDADAIKQYLETQGAENIVYVDRA